MAMSESRRRKLAMLARTIGQRDFASASKLLAEHGHSAVNRPQQKCPEPRTLCEACGGRQVHLALKDEPAPFHLIRKKLSHVAGESPSIAADYAAVMRGARQRFDELAASAALCHAADAKPSEPLFMDIETCGLAGSSIFLIGTMAFRGEELVFHQHFARNYAEEAAILHAFARKYARSSLLVTFNGKAFDMTMIRDRSAFHGVSLPGRDIPHLDLLQEARRNWKGRVPNCKLQTLEKHLCGRGRVGDIPGSEIPAAYHRFVDNGDARVIADILHHNLLDLLTMSQLLCALLTGAAPAGD